VKRFKNSVLGKFVGDSLLMWGANMAGVFISVIATIFVTRALGPEGRGVYTWLMTLAGIGSNIAVFGLDTSNRRLAVSQPDKIPELLQLNIRIILGLGSAVAVLLAAVAAGMGMAQGSALAIIMAVVTVPLSALTMAIGAMFVAQQKIARAAGVGFWPKVFGAVVSAALVIMGAVSVETAVGGSLLVAVAAMGMVLWWMRGSLQGARQTAFWPYVRTVWRTCSATYLAGLAYYLMQKVDVLMIGYYMGEAPTGYYGVASNLVDLMIMPISLIAWMLASRVAVAHKAGEATGLTRQVVALTMGLAVIGSAFTWVIAPWLVRFLFGEAFDEAANVLRLLCFAVVGLSFFMLMHNLLLATGRARYLAWPAVVGCAVNVLLNMVLIPQYGLWGACVASIIAYPLAGVVAYGLLRKR
jgi:O-antigen/teichoic acid export membrane protein